MYGRVDQRVKLDSLDMRDQGGSTITETDRVTKVWGKLAEGVMMPGSVELLISMQPTRTGGFNVLWSSSSWLRASFCYTASYTSLLF